MKKIILFISIVFCFSCEEEVIEQNLLEFLIGKVYETQSSGNDFWNIGEPGDGKMYAQFFEDGVESLRWDLYHIPDNDNNCSLAWVFDVQGYGMWTVINTPLELRIDGVYGQFWVFTKTSKNKIEILYGMGAGSGSEQYRGEALKLEKINLGDFNKLNCN